MSRCSTAVKGYFNYVHYWPYNFTKDYNLYRVSHDFSVISVTKTNPVLLFGPFPKEAVPKGSIRLFPFSVLTYKTYSSVYTLWGDLDKYLHSRSYLHLSPTYGESHRVTGYHCSCDWVGTLRYKTDEITDSVIVLYILKVVSSTFFFWGVCQN